MADIKVNKNAVEIREELKANGTTIEYIVIDGHRCGILGSTGKADRDAALKALQDTYTASNGNIMEMMDKLSIIATIEEKKIEPNEVIKIKKTDVMLSYMNRKAYTMSGNEIANCDDLPNMPNEAIKAVLVARAEAALK